MKLFGSHAHGAELAKLLAGVLRQTGHLKTDPLDIQELIRAANTIIAAGGGQAILPAVATSYVQTVPDHCDRIVWRGDYLSLPVDRTAHVGTPVFVVELDGGTVLKTSGTLPAHLIFVDQDTEGGDADQIIRVLGQEQYVIQHQADSSPAGAALVDQALTDLTAAAEQAEASRPLPRYVVGPNWKQFLPNMNEEQEMRFVFDTQTREILAMQLETDSGYMLATSAATAHVLEGLFECQEALANPYTYGLEYVDHIPIWAEPAASLASPAPVVFFMLPNYDGPPQFSTQAVQEHAIAYILVDRLAAGRENGYAPSIGDLPELPAPAYPGMPERWVDDNFSKEQLIEYRELAAEMDRHAHVQAQAENQDEDEEFEAPRG